MKHLKKFATDVAVLSVGLLAGVQVALPLWQDADAQDVLAFSSMSDWTAAVPAMDGASDVSPWGQQEPMGAPAGEMRVLVAPAVPPMQPAVTDGWQPGMPLNAPKNEETPDAKDLQIQMLARQLADAQAIIQELQRQLDEMGAQRAAAPAPVPMAGQEMSLPSDEWVAAPVAPAGDDGFLCRVLGIGC